jgi:hypothetical protein
MWGKRHVGNMESCLQITTLSTGVLITMLSGRGSTGRVELARWTTSEERTPAVDRYLAVKIVERDCEHEPENATSAPQLQSLAIRRLEHEQRLLMRLGHPGVAKMSAGGRQILWLRSYCTLHDAHLRSVPRFLLAVSVVSPLHLRSPHCFVSIRTARCRLTFVITLVA